MGFEILMLVVGVVMPLLGWYAYEKSQNKKVLARALVREQPAVLKEWARLRWKTQNLTKKKASSLDVKKAKKQMDSLYVAEDRLFYLYTHMERVTGFEREMEAWALSRKDPGCQTCWDSEHGPRHEECAGKIMRLANAEQTLFETVVRTYDLKFAPNS